ncbi:MAG: gliding motility-associated C-terminal domain-containing protein, partial [Bacteroidota bacterium]|nr:gliding motility-associated C-terminal domain-containing protein [Bacteroidota bacterium]
TYIPNENFNGDDFFTYTIKDEYGTTSTAKVDIKVIRLKSFPVDDSYSTRVNQPVNGNLISNDILSGTGKTICEVAKNPYHGKVSVNRDGTFLYIPDTYYIGDDEFIYSLRDANGNISTGKGLIQVNLSVPDGFSPNGDGINDYFEIKDLQGYPNAKMDIFDRWGNLVYSKEHYGDEVKWGKDAWWDGRNRVSGIIGNKTAPSGSYIFVIHLNYNTNKIVKGIVFVGR